MSGGQEGMDDVSEDLPERAMDGWALLGTQLAYRDLLGRAPGDRVEINQTGYFGETVRIFLEREELE